MCDTNTQKTKIIGIGGAGCAVVDTMLKRKIRGAEYYVCDTGEGALNLSGCENKISVTPARVSAFAAAKELFEVVLDADLLIIISGLGGHTGSALAPVLAEIAKGNGAVVVAVVCTPLGFEGEDRMNKSAESLEKLKSRADTVIVIPNHRIYKLVPAHMTMRTMLSVSDTVASEIVNSIVAPIYEAGVINVEFEEVSSILKGGGLAYFGVGSGKGENMVNDAVKGAICNPIPSIKINSATRFLVTVKGGNDMQLQDISAVAEGVRNAVGPTACVVLSVQKEERLSGKMRVTVIGTA